MIDGTPTGSRSVEIGNWSGKALYFPRTDSKNILSRPEFKDRGVYLLISRVDSPDYADSVYVGEAEQLKRRIEQHIAKRDFDEAIAFLDARLTKAHVQYLEARLISMISEIGVSQLENRTSPKTPYLPEGEISDMEYFLDQIKIILPLIGLNSLIELIIAETHQPDKTVSGENIFFIKSATLKATMIESESGFVVQVGSQAKSTIAESTQIGRIRLRKKLIDKGLLIEKAGHYEFSENVAFTSPSAAASIVLGRQAPGPICWINESGHTYKKVKGI